MKKYFCDVCGKEKQSYELQAMKLTYAGNNIDAKNILEEVCLECGNGMASPIITEINNFIAKVKPEMAKTK